jgi:hypothetical protein
MGFMFALSFIYLISILVRQTQKLRRSPVHYSVPIIESVLQRNQSTPSLVSKGEEVPVNHGIPRMESLLKRTQSTPSPVSKRDEEVDPFYLNHSSNRRPVAPVSCSTLLEGNLEAQAAARDYMEKNPRTVIEDSTFIRLTENCTDFKLKRGYFLKPLSTEEAEFPIAYSILMFRHLEQAEQLLRAIYQPQNVYCIHVDAKQPDLLHTSVKALTRCFDNVFIASKLEKIAYAGFSRLKADINCMSDVLKNKEPWKYYINLASQAFPLKTNLEMVKILKIYNGSNDIEGMKNKVKTARFIPRWEESFLPSGGTRVEKTNLTNPDPPYNISIVRGSAYGIFSRAFVDFIVNDKRAQALLEWSRYTFSPDEHYWSTLHHIKYNMFLNTPGGYTGQFVLAFIFT